MHRIARALQAAALLCLCVAAHADDVLEANARIDELIVTGMRAKRLAELPRSANVITAEDIALSPSTNIVDLIAREANVQLRSTVGNDKFSGVDIRGQGDTYTSNVLVLVDGIRLNSEDQAGPDYSSLPLEQVERIEVIRGANSVRYGNGAVGGVINIITRRAGGDAAGINANARLRTGSYGTWDAGVGGS
ncbi:MAG: TonB-dependent receptor plug domain-containing protein, partial [Gammaproteobacteria bacterium]|nr:TonB-dependent receptor plug domain-containing protein [Gammaproteobacteria bacterium]